MILLHCGTHIRSSSSAYSAGRSLPRRAAFQRLLSTARPSDRASMDLALLVLLPPPPLLLLPLLLVTNPTAAVLSKPASLALHRLRRLELRAKEALSCTGRCDAMPAPRSSSSSSRSSTTAAAAAVAAPAAAPAAAAAAAPPPAALSINGYKTAVASDMGRRRGNRQQPRLAASDHRTTHCSGPSLHSLATPPRSTKQRTQREEAIELAGRRRRRRRRRWW
jgi:hypothetical protein